MIRNPERIPTLRFELLPVGHQLIVRMKGRGLQTERRHLSSGPRAIACADCAKLNIYASMISALILAD
jgi:hypothetical protein